MKWINIGLLNESTYDFKNINKDIGIYKASLKDKLVYIGKATELDNGGFRKRLRDYTRENDSARNYESGRLMFNNRNNITIEVLLFERYIKEKNNIAHQEEELIKLFNPLWNTTHN